jgi:glycosyltransferase involved in cell wall biosynthesis
VKVALIAPAWFQVPPSRYGGIEWVVSILADGLVEHGHEVTLYAAGESRTHARLVTSYDEPPSYRIGLAMPDLHHALTCLEDADEFDLVNDHSGLLACALGQTVRTPFCHTVHGPLTGEPGRIYAQIANVCSDVRLISLSESQRAPQPNLNWLATCHNAINIEDHPYDPGDDGYLLFLGRMSADKGAKHAVSVARETGLPLKLAGKMHDADEREYFDASVRPHLDSRIEYLGEVNHDEKIRLLQRALLTLFPIQWPEPFGLVMVESMACGTPVIGTRQGAVPEVIQHGRGGLVVDSIEEMARCVEAAAALPREQVRAVAVERFSPRRMVRDYELAFARLLEETGRST